MIEICRKLDESKHLTSIHMRDILGERDRETGVQSQGESYQRLKKFYLIPTCLTLSIIKYGSRVKGSTLPLHFGVVAIEKETFGSPSTMVAKFIPSNSFKDRFLSFSI